MERILMTKEVAGVNLSSLTNTLQPKGQVLLLMIIAKLKEKGLSVKSLKHRYVVLHAKDFLGVLGGDVQACFDNLLQAARQIHQSEIDCLVNEGGLEIFVSARFVDSLLYNNNKIAISFSYLALPALEATEKAIADFRLPLMLDMDLAKNKDIKRLMLS